MSTKYITIFVVLLITITVFPVHAVQLDAVIEKNSEEFVPTFQFTRIVTIQYDENSKLAELIGDTQHEIIFDIDLENATMLAKMINSELQEKSFVKVTDIDGKYTAIIRPQKDSVTIEYKMVLHPTMQGHFIGDSPTALDSQWRGFSVSEEVLMETEFGAYDINSPKSIFAATLPNVLEYFSESDVPILDLILIDTSGLSELSLSKWESMFDPTAKMSETQEYGFSGNVTTNYSMGICTVYLGVCQDKDYQQTFVIDGEEYTIRSIESQDDATIIIEGYVEESSLGKIEIFFVQDKGPSRGNENDTQVPIMYALSGVGIVIAAGFFVWSDRKAKKTPTEQTGVDPKDLCAVSIGSSAGSYQTNRVTAYLVEK